MGTIFIDLQKAFDSIEHQLLLDKLCRYGVINKELDWFHSYLDSQQQRVFVNKLSSTYNCVTHRVLQGSCLGPLLFLAYINDIVDFIPKTELNLYEDNTAIIALENDMETLARTLQRFAAGIEKWSTQNKLNINIKKK